MDLPSLLKTAPIAPDVLSNSLWMIIALPLLGAFICGVFGRMLGRANVHLVACSAVAAAEASIGLAIVIAVFRSRGTVSIEEIRTMKH